MRWTQNKAFCYLGAWDSMKKLCSPNEDFGKPNKHFGPCFQSTFRILEYFSLATDHWKVLWKQGPRCSFGFPKSSFGRVKVDKDAVNRHFSFSRCVKFLEIYGPQTKILESWKRVRWVVLEALFIPRSAIFGPKVMKSDSKTTHRNLFSTWLGSVLKYSLGSHEIHIRTEFSCI
jgi:hypothetical protein